MISYYKHYYVTSRKKSVASDMALEVEVWPVLLFLIGFGGG